jgi:RHH-type rel operon transcriptional repressor/antitoxin RelB
MSKQTAVRLPDELNARLSALSKRTGRTVSFYLREAIEAHIDDLEDIHYAEQTLERIRRGEEEVLSAEDFWRGVED